jgi:dipeptidyl aminopeptidase/acylaminoacyl peptidase
VRQVTHENDEAVRHFQLTPLEPFSFIGALGDSVHGYLMKPPRFRRAAALPGRVPHSRRSPGRPVDNWHARWNYALFAARGYVVAAVNFHGSTGYGQEFTNSISRHCGRTTPT